MARGKVLQRYIEAFLSRSSSALRQVRFGLYHSIHPSKYFLSDKVTQTVTFMSAVFGKQLVDISSCFNSMNPQEHMSAAWGR